MPTHASNEKSSRWTKGWFAVAARRARKLVKTVELHGVAPRSLTAHVSARVKTEPALAVLLEVVLGAAAVQVAAVVQVAALEVVLTMSQLAARVQHVTMLVKPVEPHTVATGTQPTMPAYAKGQDKNALAVLEAAADLEVDLEADLEVGAAVVPRRLALRATLSQRQPVAASATLSHQQPIAAPTFQSQLATWTASRQLATPTTAAQRLLMIRTTSLDLQTCQALVLHRAGWRLPLEQLWQELRRW